MYEKHGSLFVAHDTYRSVSRENLRSWRPPSRISADAAILPVLSDLQDTSSDLIRNDSFASAAINAMVTGTVGSGLKPNSQPIYKVLEISEEKARNFAEECEQYFSLWANDKSCELGNKLNFWGIESLLFRSSLEFGDVFVAKRQRKGAKLGLCLQLIEAGRVKTPPEKEGEGEIKEGIILDKKTGEPRFAYISSPVNDFEDRFTRVGFRNPATGEVQLLQLANRKRFGQTRGVPYLANSTTLLKKMSQYAEGELSAAALSSFIAFVTKTPFDESESGDFGIGEERERPRSDIPQKIKPNTNIHLANGEEIDMLNPSRPNANFASFYDYMSKIVASELEQPLQVILCHFETSYSASRAAIIKAYQVYKLRRQWLADNFHKPVWNWFITDCVRKKIIDAPGFFESELKRRAYLNCDWVGDSCIQLDPSKESKGAKELYDLGIVSKKHLTQMLTGKSYEDVVNQLKKEKQMVPEEPIASRRKGEV